MSPLCKAVIKRAGFACIEDCIIASMILVKPLMRQPLPKVITLQLKKHLKIVEAAAQAAQSQHTNSENLEVTMVQSRST